MPCEAFLAEDGAVRLWRDFGELATFFLEEGLRILKGFVFLEECLTALREALR